MATEKERIKSLVTLRIEGIGRLLKSVVDAKTAYKKALADLEAQKETYSAEYITTKKEEALGALQGKMQAAYPDLDTRLDELGAGLTELHGTLNLDNPALANALKLIELGGPDLGAENVRNINASFIGDQPALRALQAVYKHVGVVYDGGLDRQIYEVESSIKAMKDMGYSALMREGTSLNSLAAGIGKIAALEGVAFDNLPDPQGVIDATRSAAGLPV